MRELHNLAFESGLCLVNEVGLDPGIDHLMAHTLIEEYRNSKDQDEGNAQTRGIVFLFPYTHAQCCSCCLPGEAKDTFTQWDLNGVQLPGAHGLGPPLPAPAPDLPLP